MRYTTIPNDRTKWEFIYCNKTGTATAEDIANMFCGYSGMFHTNDHTPEDCMPIKNDTGMFLLKILTDVFQFGKSEDLHQIVLGRQSRMFTKLDVSHMHTSKMSQKLRFGGRSKRFWSTN